MEHLTKNEQLYNQAYLRQFSAVPHKRHGNERAWSVTGEALHLGQIVTLHAMCGKLTAIKAAIKQDAAEYAHTDEI